MEAFATAVTDLVVAASAPGGSPDEALRQCMRVLREAKKAEAEAVNDALRRLADVILSTDVPRASLVSIGCGALVEAGGSPDLAIGAILERLPEVMERALRFAQACEQAAQADPAFKEDDDAEPPAPTPLAAFDIGRYVTVYGEQVAGRDPLGANCWMATERMGMGTIAMLSRLPAARAAGRRVPALVALADELSAYHGRATFLRKMFHVLDDEPLLVIHVPQARGYRVCIRGIADNFQLHTLLADALIGDERKGLLVGNRPDPQVAAAARDRPVAPGTPPATGAFNLVNWTGLRPDGTLPAGTSDTDSWIWNEGVPADIRPLDGLRVVLLHEPPYSRSWNPGRCFSEMPGELRLTEILSPDPVRRWIERIAQHPKPDPNGGTGMPR